jgi:hypothetical protein
MTAAPIEMTAAAMHEMRNVRMVAIPFSGHGPGNYQPTSAEIKTQIIE